jgi:hypothetical protein
LAKKKRKKDDDGDDWFRRMLRRAQERGPEPIGRKKDAYYLQQRLELNRLDAEMKHLGSVRHSSYSAEDAMRETGATPTEMWETEIDKRSHENGTGS